MCVWASQIGCKHLPLLFRTCTNMKRGGETHASSLCLSLFSGGVPPPFFPFLLCVYLLSASRHARGGSQNQTFVCECSARTTGAASNFPNKEVERKEGGKKKRRGKTRADNTSLSPVVAAADFLPQPPLPSPQKNHLGLQHTIFLSVSSARH